MIALARGRWLGKPGSGGWTVAAAEGAHADARRPATDWPSIIASATPPKRSPTSPKNCRRVVSRCCWNSGSMSWSVSVEGFVEVEHHVRDQRVRGHFGRGQVGPSFRLAVGDELLRRG